LKRIIMAEQVKTIFKGGRPCAPLLRKDGTLFFADSHSGEIKVLKVAEASEDKAADVWGNSDGQPCGLGAMPNGDLYVCDTAHSAVMSVGKDGNRSKIVSEYEKQDLKGPSSIALDSNGTMYFTDSGSLGESTLDKPTGSVFCVDGTQKSQLLRPIAFECLAHPSGVAVSPEGSAVFVCETLRNRVLRFVQRPAGVWISSVFCTFAGGLGPTAIACHGKGRNYVLYIARADLPGHGRGVITVVTSNGEVKSNIEMPAPELSGVAVSPDGSTVYVTEKSSGSIFSVKIAT